MIFASENRPEGWSEWLRQTERMKRDRVDDNEPRVQRGLIYTGGCSYLRSCLRGIECVGPVVRLRGSNEAVGRSQQ